MRLALLDRDGVLNEDRADYVKHPGELVMIEGAAAACARLTQAGVKIAIVSNQAAVGRGIISQGMLERIHEKLRGEIASQGGRIDLLLVCTDPPDVHSERRKPAPGMLREALAHFRMSPNDAVMIGDQLRDLVAARAAGVPRVLVRTGKGAELQAKGLPQDIFPVAVYDSLSTAVDGLLASH